MSGLIRRREPCSHRHAERDEQALGQDRQGVVPGTAPASLSQVFAKAEADGSQDERTSPDTDPRRTQRTALRKRKCGCRRAKSTRPEYQNPRLAPSEITQPISSSDVSSHQIHRSVSLSNIIASSNGVPRAEYSPHAARVGIRIVRSDRLSVELLISQTRPMRNNCEKHL